MWKFARETQWRLEFYQLDFFRSPRIESYVVGVYGFSDLVFI